MVYNQEDVKANTSGAIDQTLMEPYDASPAAYSG